MGAAVDAKWLFLDLNSYFASVEQQLEPELRGRPVAVVPVMADTTCAIAASYEAKAFGIQTGTAIWDAKKRCPDLKLVPARHDVYVEYHHRILAEIERHIPVSKICSIDEVACELIGRERKLDNALALAGRIKAGLAANIGEYVRASIGLASNRYLAKVATDMQKPDGLVVIDSRDLPGCLHGLTLRDLPGIGPGMERRLRRAGVDSVAALWALELKRARSIWGGVGGERFWYALHGVEVADPPTERRSIGHSHVLAPEMRPPEMTRAVARRLTVKAASRLRRMDYTAGAFVLELDRRNNVCWKGWTHVQRVQDNHTLLNALDRLWHAMLAEIGAGPAHWVGVTLDELTPRAELEPDLFATETRASQRRLQLASVMDRINRRYGKDTVVLGVNPVSPRDYVGAKVAFQRIPDVEEFYE